MLLTGDEERVENTTAVVDGDVATHRHLAGVSVDLDNRNMRTERERRVGAVEVELMSKCARLDTGGQLRSVTRRNREVTPRDGLRRRARDM